jgi:N-acetylmuramoyl-L-alanine amidase
VTRAGGLFLTLILLVPLGFLAHGAALLGVRIASHEDRLRVVMDLSAEATFQEQVLQNPHRIAINIADTRGRGLILPRVEDWMVERIRFNQLRGPTAQVVLDLTCAPSFDVFMLPAYEEKPFRIVCDVLRAADRAAGPPPERNWVVVIDPGHGGRDPGAVSRQPRLSEKEVVLDVARRLSQTLSAEPGVEVRLTRDRDTTLRLRDRVARAAELGGDIFLSIHVNGCAARSARGAEVYYLSLKGATTAASRELEALENTEDVSQDPMLGEIAALPFAVDLLQTDTILRSSLLAECVLDALGESRLAAARGVKQANFAVLRSCRVPSALVELGFISNPSDARQLASQSHRQALARTIAGGLLEYRRRYARHARSAGIAAGASDNASSH